MNAAKRYRPETWDGVVGQPTDSIRADLEDGATNFLFHGPSGTGKTTVAYLIGKAVQGSPDELVEFNASDDRGLDAVRERIIPKVHQSTLTGAPMVLFLDEMDSMTKEAQQALRQPMEQSEAYFILACNEIEAVHDAVKSRCYEYEFDALASSAIKARIRQLANAEGHDLSDQHLAVITDFAAGDMRAAIQRYTQVTRGAYTVGATADPVDGSSIEQSARRYLDGGE